MSKDEALEQWIVEDMCDVPCALPVDEAGEYMCRAAWFAAVRHTLEYVAGELNKRANVTAGLELERVANVMRNLAVDIANMKP